MRQLPVTSFDLEYYVIESPDWSKNCNGFSLETENWHNFFWLANCKKLMVERSIKPEVHAWSETWRTVFVRKRRISMQTKTTKKRRNGRLHSYYIEIYVLFQTKSHNVMKSWSSKCNVICAFQYDKKVYHCIILFTSTVFLGINH